MEQNLPLNQVIGVWLADYSHFICNRLNLPHNQAVELFREYLDLTAREPSQKPVASPYEQRTSYPEPPSSSHTTPYHEQHPNLNSPTRPQTLSPIHLQGPNPIHEPCSQDQPRGPHPLAHNQTLPLGYSKAPTPYHETYDKEQPAQSTTSIALPVPNTVRQAPLPHSVSQSDSIIPTNSDGSETGVLPPQPIPPIDQTPIGSIKELDPLWVQHNKEDPTAVEGYFSSMKFETLLIAGVIKIGDVLAFQVSVPGHGKPLETEAHLSVRPNESLAFEWLLY